MLSPSLEDYLEEIYRLSLIKSEIRVRDIAEKLNVSSPSVVKALRKLHDASYIIYKKYEGIHLTKEGKKLGSLLVKRNHVLQQFLSVINSPCDVEAEAEAMEHYLSPPTIWAIEKLVEFMKKDPETMKKFESFCEVSEKKHWSEEIE
ncbi:MAG: DNA-binding protein [Marinisporobacter sp.]|jgi:Mn-dependent DtxR family transcriptional regulator|nr:DNA-binding protein [Marinisporobacter sp.]